MIERLSGLKEHLQRKIIGQPEAVDVVTQTIQRCEMGHAKVDRPKAVFLFMGPTGVGKTETVNAVCDYFNSSTDNATRHPHMARFDMAEYQLQTSVEKFLGWRQRPQGLLGDEIDRLRSSDGAVKILLFDEIEKANQELLKIFFGALDAARITMDNGATKSLMPFYCFFTSNLGSNESTQMENVPYTTLVKHVEQTASKFFTPPGFARFTSRVVFRKLSYETQLEICRSMLRQDLEHFSRVWNRPVTVHERVFNYLVKRGYTKTLGARPMRDTIEKELGNVLTRWALDHYQEKGSKPSGTTPLEVWVQSDARREFLGVREISTDTLAPA